MGENLSVSQRTNQCDWALYIVRSRAMLVNEKATLVPLLDLLPERADGHDVDSNLMRITHTVEAGETLFRQPEDRSKDCASTILLHKGYTPLGPPRGDCIDLSIQLPRHNPEEDTLSPFAIRSIFKELTRNGVVSEDVEDVSKVVQVLRRVRNGYDVPKDIFTLTRLREMREAQLSIVPRVVRGDPADLCTEARMTAALVRSAINVRRSTIDVLWQATKRGFLPKDASQWTEGMIHAVNAHISILRAAKWLELEALRAWIERSMGPFLANEVLPFPAGVNVTERELLRFPIILPEPELELYCSD